MPDREKPIRLDLRPSPDWAAALDEWIKHQPGKAMGRAEAGRRIISERIEQDRKSWLRRGAKR